MTLIISPNLVLTPPTRLDLSMPIIGWRNQVTMEGVEADYQDDANPIENLTNPATNLFWRSTSLEPQYVTFFVDESDPVDYIGIARHNLAASGAILSVEVQLFDDGEWLELIEGFVIRDDSPIIIRFFENYAGSVRLKIVPFSAPPQIAVVYIGRLTVMPMGITAPHTPLIDGRDTRVTTGISEAGEYLGTITLSQKLSTSVLFRFLTGEWYRHNMRPFVRQGRGTPFFFSGFPEQHPREAGYAWLTSDPRPSFRDAGWVDITLDIGGIIY